MRLTAVFLALFLAQPAAAETVRLGDRSYDIDLPANPRGAKLIVALHDRGGDPDQFALASSFGRAAVSAGYAVTFPAGTRWRSDRLWAGGVYHWPGGRKAWLTKGKTEQSDANFDIPRFFALHP